MIVIIHNSMLDTVGKSTISNKTWLKLVLHVHVDVSHESGETNYGWNWLDWSNWQVLCSSVQGFQSPNGLYFFQSLPLFFYQPGTCFLLVLRKIPIRFPVLSVCVYSSTFIT